MKVLSLFDGISCARVAISRAGLADELLHRTDGERITYYASETDKYAIQIAQKNFPDTIQLGDIRTIGHDTIARLQNKMIAEIDLMVGGSPCQDLSIAKKDRKGLAGARSGLFYEYVRLLKEVKPKWFILENVNSMPKEAKEQISEIMGVQPIMINAALVSAQNRKRLFWTNIPNIEQPKDREIFLKDILEDGVNEMYQIPRGYNLGGLKTGKAPTMGANSYQHNNKPITKNGAEKLKSSTIRNGGRSSGIEDRHNWDTIRIGQIGKGGQGDRIYSPEGKSVNLSANGGGRGAKTGLYRIMKEPHGTALDYYNDIIVPNGKAKILGTNPQSTTAVAGQLVNDNFVVRKLTPIECERLQSLPDNYTEGVSNSQRYKMLGNAFNVEVVKHILSYLL